METILIGNVDADLSIEMHFYWNWTQRRRRMAALSWLSLPGPLAANSTKALIRDTRRLSGVARLQCFVAID
jgi:hypothetical protein